MSTQPKLKLGDRVSGLYMGDYPFVGVIASFDMSGYVYVDLDAPIMVLGRPREGGIALHRQDRHTLRLVEAGPVLTDDDVGTVRGGGPVFLRRRAVQHG